MLENGKMIDAICNQPGEIKTCFSLPEDIKYGFKDSQFLGYPIANKEEESRLSEDDQRLREIIYEGKDEIVD